MVYTNPPRKTQAEEQKRASFESAALRRRRLGRWGILPNRVAAGQGTPEQVPASLLVVDIPRAPKRLGFCQAEKASGLGLGVYGHAMGFFSSGLQ